MNENDFVKVKVEDAVTPKEGYMAMLNRWWAVKDGYIFFYRGFSPQCNPNQKITERLPLCAKYGAVATFIPLVFIDHDCGHNSQFG